MRDTNHNILRSACLNLLLACGTLSAAEVRGSVSVQHAGMFDARNEVLKEFPVSVALYPAEGQSVPGRLPHSFDILVSGNQIRPLYLAVTRGDRVHFQNRDQVYHELFTHAHTRPLEVHLDREGLGRDVTLALNDVVNLHWFCRIHAKSYARIDVLDTPLVRMVNPGETFEFRDLQAGKWRLRIAAPGAETRVIETQAVTAPPPIQAQLTVKGFGQPGTGLEPPQSASVEQLFPSQPGL